MNEIAAIENLLQRADRTLTKYNAAGTPIQTAGRVINGHMVEVRLTGWGWGADRELHIHIHVDRRATVRTVTEAAELISA